MIWLFSVFILDVFDVYRLRQNKVYLVDFNPYGPVTDGLLFSWDELLCDKPLGFDFTSQAPIVRSTIIKYFVL